VANFGYMKSAINFLLLHEIHVLIMLN